ALEALRARRLGLLRVGPRRLARLAPGRARAGVLEVLELVADVEHDVRARGQTQHGDDDDDDELRSHRAVGPRAPLRCQAVGRENCRDSRAVTRRNARPTPPVDKRGGWMPRRAGTPLAPTSAARRSTSAPVLEDISYGPDVVTRVSSRTC